MASTLSVDELAKTSEFLSLPPKHQLWLSSYCQTLIDFGAPDIEFATRSAFQTRGESARTFGYQILSDKRVRAALRVFLRLGESKRAPFLEDVRAEIERLLALYAKFGKSSKRKVR